MDKDLERILHLVEIIRKYESLVDFLLEPKTDHDIPSNHTEYMKKVERDIIIKAMQATNGTVAVAAKKLKVNYSSLKSKIKRLDITPGDYK